MKEVRKSQVMGNARDAAKKLGRALNARFDRREEPEIKIKVLTRAYELAYPPHGRDTGIHHDAKGLSHDAKGIHHDTPQWYNGIAVCLGEPEEKTWWDKLF